MFTLFLVPIILIGRFLTLLINWLSRTRVNLTLALAGLPGKILFRLPGGLTIFLGALRFLFALWVTQGSILLVNELMEAVLPFCPGLSGGSLNTLPPELPDPSGPSDLALVEEAASEEDPCTSRKRRAPEKDEWGGPSREAAEEAARDKRRREWKPDFSRFIKKEPEPCDPVLVYQWKRDILSVLQKECRLPIKFNRREFEAALVKLHEGRGHFVWLDNLNALEREGERCPFFLQLVEEVKRLKFCR